MRESINKYMYLIAVALIIIICVQQVIGVKVKDKGAEERAIYNHKLDSIAELVESEVSRRLVLLERLERLKTQNKALRNKPAQIQTKYVEVRTEYSNLTELGKDSAFASRLP